uniref:Uncharacterized protein n=1 Tax=Magallana gigas TaxID=29159 RepID=K1RYD9_MAGGI
MCYIRKLKRTAVTVKESIVIITGDVRSFGVGLSDEDVLSQHFFVSMEESVEAVIGTFVRIHTATTRSYSIQRGVTEEVCGTSKLWVRGPTHTSLGQMAPKFAKPLFGSGVAAGRHNACSRHSTRTDLYRQDHEAFADPTDGNPCSIGVPHKVNDDTVTCSQRRCPYGYACVGRKNMFAVCCPIGHGK